MLIKSKRITIRIFATFLILALTLCLFTISVSASDYSDVNDTVYKSADYFGLEELPYGEDTAVVQFQYGTNNFLTLYFDKLTIYQDYAVLDRDYSNLSDYYWNASYVVNDLGEYDYKINIASDSPIYYKTSYTSNGVFSSSLGTQTTRGVYVSQQLYEGTTVMSEKYYAIYELNDFLLSDIVPSSWNLYGARRVYSNVFMVSGVDLGSGSDRRLYYRPLKAAGQTNFVNGTSVGYNVEYYPSVEYLQNLSARDVLLSQYDELVYMSGELYTANSYLNSIYELDLSILGHLETYLPLMYGELADIHDVLEDILSGPEYDSSQGVGSNTEFGDAAGGLMQDTQVPSMDVGGIQSNLGSSFLFIRNMFDWLTGNLNLTYVISFLLGLSFIAYVLGRVIRNKMKG